MSKKIDIEIIYPAVVWDEVAQKPTEFIPSEHTQDISTINGLQDELDNKADSSILADVATSGSYNDLEDKPNIPDSLSDLSDDSSHRTVTDTEKLTWNSKQDALGYTPENSSNKENTTIDTSTTKYPTNNLVKTNLDLKVDKVTGKGLSTNDFTNELKLTYDGYATGKQNTITTGTTFQYLKGDLSLGTMDKSAVGLGNVDNTSDANKPVSTAQQIALNNKANLNGSSSENFSSKILTTTDLNIYGYSLGSSGSSNNNKYRKVLTTTIDARYKFNRCKFILLGGGNLGNLYKGEISLSLKQNSAMGTDPYADLYLENNVNLKTSDIVAICTEKISSQTTVELFLYYPDVFVNFNILPISTYTYDPGCTLTYYNNGDIYETLPSGTQFQSRYGGDYKNIDIKTANYTATLNNSTIKVDSTTGNKTISLPSANSCLGFNLLIKKIDSTYNTVTIDAYGSETIDGSLTYVIGYQYNFIQIQSDGVNWNIVGEG